MHKVEVGTLNQPINNTVIILKASISQKLMQIQAWNSAHCLLKIVTLFPESMKQMWVGQSGISF